MERAEYLKRKAVYCLRVNIKSLASEARYIRKEEKRIPSDPPKDWNDWHSGDNLRGCLHWHRVDKVRKEARIAQLAYAAIRGVPYKSVERSTKSPPDWNRVKAKARKHDVDVTPWIREAVDSLTVV